MFGQKFQKRSLLEDIVHIEVTPEHY